MEKACHLKFKMADEDVLKEIGMLIPYIFDSAFHN